MKSTLLFALALLVAATLPSAAADREMSRAKGGISDFKNWCEKIPDRFKNAVNSVDTAISSVGTFVDNAGGALESSVKKAGNSINKAATDSLSFFTDIAKDIATLISKLEEIIVNMVPGVIKEVFRTVIELAKREAKDDFADVKVTWGSLPYLQDLNEQFKYGVPNWVWKRAQVILGGIPSLTGMANTILKMDAAKASLVEEMAQVHAEAAAEAGQQQEEHLRSTAKTTPLYDCVQEDEQEDRSLYYKEYNEFETQITSCNVMIATASFFDAVNSSILGLLSALDDTTSAPVQLPAWILSTVLGIIAASLRVVCALGGH